MEVLLYRRAKTISENEHQIHQQPEHVGKENLTRGVGISRV